MATKSVLVHLDLGGNEIQNVLAQKLATAPGNPSAGQFYYNTTDNLLYVYNGSAWLNAMSQGKIYTGGTGITVTDTVISADFTEVATAAQGGLADTAIQPNDNISALTNDVGYITSAPLDNYVPITRTVNSKALSANISLDYTDVGALASTTTINDLTTTEQQNALNSGATTSNIGQIATNTTDIATINGKIPNQASSSNQLADKNFVNSSISTNTAYFDGTWNTYADVPTTVAGFTNDGFPEPTNNNYLVVKEDETQDGGTWRYKYVDDGGSYSKNNWHVEYEVNETPLTAAQLAALNSGITDTLVTQIGTNASDISDLQTNQVTASNTITFTNKTIDADDNTISDLKVANFATNVVRTEVRASGTADNNSLVTEAAVRTAIDSATHKFTATNPALTASAGVCTWSITNSFADADVILSIKEVATGNEVLCDVTYGASTITVKINSTSDITAGVYKAVVMG